MQKVMYSTMFCLSIGTINVAQTQEIPMKLGLAIEQFKASEVLALLNESPNLIQSVDHYGNTPLHLACKAFANPSTPNSKIIARIWEMSPDKVQVRNKDKLTPVELFQDEGKQVDLSTPFLQARLATLKRCFEQTQ